MVRTKGAKKGRGLTNAEASAKYGLAPILDDAGSVAILHHSQQKGVGPLYEVQLLIIISVMLRELHYILIKES